MAEECALARVDAKLRASVFGEFRLSAPDNRPIILHNRRASLILAILFLQTDHSIDRDLLAKLLWPDRSTRRQRRV